MAELLSLRLMGSTPWLGILPTDFVVFKNFFKLTHFTAGGSAVLGDMERHCCIAQSKLLGLYL